MNKKQIWLLVFSILCFNDTLPGQSSAGQISGLIQDASGAVLDGVSLEARESSTGAILTARSDSTGRYEFLRVPRGEYTITASFQGFQSSQQKTVLLSASQSITLDLVLQVQAAQQSITVTGDPAALDLSSSHIGHLVNQVSLESLPINGRSLEQLALLAPGMIPVRAKEDRALNGFTQKVSGNGARGTLYLLDGMDTQHSIFSGNTPGGASGSMLGMDAVQEFEVLTDAYPAYHGGAGGAIVDVITRRGGSDFHGSAFEYYRGDSLDARNFFDDEIPSFSRHQFGASLGGPLPGESNNFFFSYEGLRERLGTTLFDTVPNLAARDGNLPGGNVEIAPEMLPYLALYPEPNGEDFGDGSALFSYQQNLPTDDHYFNIRTDFDLGDSDSLFFRYTFQDSERISPFGLSIQGYDSASESRNQYLTVEETHIFSPRLLNSFQLSYNRSVYSGASLTDPSLDVVDPLIAGRTNLGRINIRGLSSLGTDTAEIFNPSNQYELSDSFQHSRGNHDLRWGFNWKHYRSNGRYDFFFDGLLVYEALDLFLTNSPARFIGAEPGADSHKNYRQNLFALYVHDKIRVSPDFTLSLGLRYEWYTVPTEVRGRISNLRNLMDPFPTVGDPLFENPSKLDFAPRIGLAWNVGGSDSTVLRTGFGIFYDPIRENTFGFGARTQQPFVTVRTFIRPPFPDPTSGRIAGRPRADTVEFEPSTPYLMRYHLALQQALPDDWTMRISYIGSRGVHLTRTGDLNTPEPLSFDENGNPFWGLDRLDRRNPEFDLVRFISTDANSNYNALGLGLTRRWNDGFQFGLNYTFGRSIDDASASRRSINTSVADVPPDRYNRTRDRALSSFHVKHNAVVRYTWDIPYRGGSGFASALLRDWRTGGILTVASGFPFNANVSFDRANNRVREGHRPNLVPGASNNPILGGPERYFDVGAFELQEEGTLGNLGRNTLISPGYMALDMMLNRSILLTEDHTIELRLEVFNILNRANFAPPQNSGTGGVIIFNNAGGVPVGNAARILSTISSSRQVQLGFRWSF